MRLIALCCSLWCLLAVLPAQAAEPYVEIERRLTPEQLHATGLDTLSPEQLALLNRLLGESEGRVVEEAKAQARADAEIEAAAQRREAAQAAAQAPRGPGRFAGLDDGPIKGRIAGDVAGWQPGDVFTLDNGQQWKILKGSLTLRTPLHDPEVRVVPGIAGRWFLQFDEDLPKARVYRVD